MMRLAGMSHTSRSAAVLAKDSGIFQIFWSLQEGLAVLTFFGLTALGSYLKCLMLHQS